MGCFSCGKTFRPGDRKIVLNLKKEFEDHGIERYVYRLSLDGDLMVVRKEYFNEIYVSKIKPNLQKGAEYMHISEYTGA